MCWNPDISINTFIFSCLTLSFIYFTNTYTKYKTPFFDNPVVYLFFLAVVSMQLIEFFLWRNLKNKDMNKKLSKLASFFIILQQIFIILLIPSSHIRYSILSFYILFILFFVFYYKRYISPATYHTSIGKNGHLSWEWINYKGYENIWLFIFLLFYIVPALLINNLMLTLLIIITLLFSLFFYFKYNTFGTIWCWSVNIFLLYFIVNILLIKPYYEYNGLC